MIKENERFPAGNFHEMSAEGPRQISTDEIFSGKKVVLFHVVGAFTPTCTVDHLPAYIDRQDEILAKGVDSIVCFSTNDAMVMQSWNEHVSAGRTHQVRVVSDGNGEVIRSLGLELDATGLGMGARGKRFAMIVDDGVVSHLFVEDNPAVATVSAADSIVQALS